MVAPRSDQSRPPWYAQNAIGNLLTFIGMSALVMWWASTQSARIDVLVAEQFSHTKLAGHNEMLKRERALLKQITMLEIQMQDLRRQVNGIRNACPDLYEGMNPTNYTIEPS